MMRYLPSSTAFTKSPLQSASRGMSVKQIDRQPSERSPLVRSLSRTSSGSAVSIDTSAYDLPFSTKVHILAGTFSAGALGAIDTSITATLISAISSSFHASNESSWLGTAYLLSSIAFTPLYGRLCDAFGRRLSNASAIFIFALGNLLCAVAPSFSWFVAARFIAGIGGGGMLSTSAIIASDLFPLRSRGVVTAISGLTWSVGSATGGYIGGVINDRFGWRAAFGFQVPLLLVCLVSGLSKITYAYQNQKESSYREKLARVDYLGPATLLLCFGSLLSLLSLTSNQGKTVHDVSVIMALVGTIVFGIAFVVLERWYVKEPILAFDLLRNRTAICVCLMTTCLSISNFTIMYHLPLFFITVKGAFPATAGAHLTVISAGQVIGSALGGLFLHRYGRYWGINIFFSSLLIAGLVLLLRMSAKSGVISSWFSVLPFALGHGCLTNTALIVLMTIHPNQVALANSLSWLFRSTGQLAGVGLSSAIFQASLSSELKKRITDPKIIHEIRTNTDGLSELPRSIEKLARAAYGASLKHVFIFGLVTTVVIWLGALATEDLFVDNPKEFEDQQAANAHASEHHRRRSSYILQA